VKHLLKTWPEAFQAIVDKRKTYEIRVNDREFQVGDVLHLQEFNPETRMYTGRDEVRRVSHMTRGGEWGLPDHLCVLALQTV